MATDPTRPIPKRQKHHAFDESVDEPAGLIADQPAEIEEEIPAEENEPVETVEEAEDSATFEQ